VCIAELDLSRSAIHEIDGLLEPYNSTKDQPLLTEQLDEYDSCVGRVHINLTPVAGRTHVTA
jgi:hypothetical protein